MSFGSRNATFLLCLSLLLTRSAMCFPLHPQEPAPAQPAPTSELSPQELGNIAFARGEYAAAIDALSRAPQDSATIQNKLGMAYHHLFAIGPARRYYEQALRLHPDYPEALNNLGAIHYAQGDYKKALRCVRKAIDLSPRSSLFYRNLGTILFAQDKPDEAAAAWQTAVTLNPQAFADLDSDVPEPAPVRLRARQSYALARIFARSHNNAQALAWLRQAFNQGFDDRQTLLADDALADLRATPEFTRLLQAQNPH